MRLGQDWPWTVAVGASAVAALGIAAYAVGAGGFTTPLAASAIAVLAFGMVLVLVRGMQVGAAVKRLVHDHGRMENDHRHLMREHRDQQSMRATLANEIAALRADSQVFSRNITDGLGTLRASHEQIAASLQSLMDSAAQTAAVADVLPVSFADEGYADEEPVAQIAEEGQAPAVPAETETPFGDALNLSLEPIIDLYTSQTAHYRMILGMTNEQGQEVAHDVFIHHAERMGLRHKLDAFVVREALGILYQLRRRDPNLSIFIPIGASTLASRDTLHDILRTLQQEPSLASGVVIDVPHAVLASLPDASLEGLAMLARAGVLLSLSQASIAGIDLAALGKLNVRYVGLAAASIGLETRISSGLAGFVQAARALRIQVVISHVGDPRHVANLSRVARFASGPAFANPRRLRRNGQSSNSFSAAA